MPNSVSRLNAESAAHATPAESTLSCSRVVGAPPDKVWQELAALDQIDRWAKGVDHAAFTTTITQGPGAVRRVTMGLITVIETVTAWGPPRHLAYTIEGLPTFLVRRVTNSWQLEPAGEGTRVTLTTLIVARPHRVGRLAAAVLRRVMAGVSDKLLGGLADYFAAPASSS